MNSYGLSSRVLFRLKRKIGGLSNSLDRFVNYRMSRNAACKQRKRVIKRNGRRIVDDKLKTKIKKYCKKSFGSSSYWPWISLYAEMRGEFIEGWIPDDFYRFEILRKINPKKFELLSEAKTLDHKIFPNLIKKPLLTRIQGKYYDLQGNCINTHVAQKYINDLNLELVIKPDNGSQGRDITFLYSSDVKLNKLSPENDLVFQEVFRQHTSLVKVHPYSLNTFRVTTYIDAEGEIRILFVNLRFGVGGNRVDNTSSGGMWVSIGLNGTVRGAIFDDSGLETGYTHPNTGYKLSDLELPFFNEIVSTCRNAHRRLPHVGLVGWDVFVNEEGKPEILEWNANNPWFWEVEARFGPLWSEEEIKGVMECDMNR